MDKCLITENILSLWLYTAWTLESLTQGTCLITQVINYLMPWIKLATEWDLGCLIFRLHFLPGSSASVAVSTGLWKAAHIYHSYKRRGGCLTSNWTYVITETSRQLLQLLCFSRLATTTLKLQDWQLMAAMAPIRQCLYTSSLLYYVIITSFNFFKKEMSH